uniref:Uncharacterized protein n=1 Tax=Bracon brevicornis TaxID=1563983 RepID=A0A6V7KLY4_9HYME
MGISIEVNCDEAVTPEENKENLMQQLTDACDAVMSRGKEDNRHTLVYLWSGKIAQFPTSCYKPRRRRNQHREKSLAAD